MDLKKRVLILIILSLLPGSSYSAFIQDYDFEPSPQPPVVHLDPRIGIPQISYDNNDFVTVSPDNLNSVSAAVSQNPAAAIGQTLPGQGISFQSSEGASFSVTGADSTQQLAGNIDIQTTSGQTFTSNEGSFRVDSTQTFDDGSALTTGTVFDKINTVNEETGEIGANYIPVREVVISSPAPESKESTTIAFIENKREQPISPTPTPPPPTGFPSLGQLFPTIYPRLELKQIQSNFCGNGLLVYPEQCETANTYSNPYCIQTAQACGNVSATKDKLGKCNANCQCVYDCNCLSKDETCNGVDDDCNSIVDDYKIGTCVNQEALCPNQLGVCKNTEKTCAGASGFMPCTSQNYNKTGKYQETESYCDNLDNDCDGSIDEGCDCVPESTKPCGYSNDGACRLGTQTCDTSGKWGACVNSVAPSLFTETVCDSIDNDCDFLVDECLLNQCGECGQVPQEICNYRDDDCDAEPQSPQTAAFNQVTKSYFNFNNYCESGTTCKGVYADGIDNNNNSIADEGVDEYVKEKPNETYTSWCKSCETQNRRCQTYQETKFKQIHSEYYYNYKLDLKEATEKQILQNSSGTFYFACQPNDLDIACCLENQCVYNGQCYSKGHREDIDNDGIVEVCFSQSPGVWHELGEAICENDCTFFDDNIVHAACDGQNGCAFYDNTAKSVCDNSQPGWVRDYNSTHYVVCASGSPQPKIEIAASVSCESGTLVKMTRIVVYNGKPVKLVVAVCG